MKMRLISLILIASFFLITSQAYSELERITDTVNLFSQEDKIDLETIYKKLHRDTQVFLITIDSTLPLFAEQYAHKISKEEQLKENFVILIVATQDKEMAIKNSSDLHFIFLDNKEKIISEAFTFCKLGNWSLGSKYLLHEVILQLNKKNPRFDR